MGHNVGHMPTWDITQRYMGNYMGHYMGACIGLYIWDITKEHIHIWDII